MPTSAFLSAKGSWRWSVLFLVKFLSWSLGEAVSEQFLYHEVIFPVVIGKYFGRNTFGLCKSYFSSKVLLCFHSSPPFLTHWSILTICLFGGYVKGFWNVTISSRSQSYTNVYMNMYICILYICIMYITYRYVFLHIHIIYIMCTYLHTNM